MGWIKAKNHLTLLKGLLIQSVSADISLIPLNTVNYKLKVKPYCLL